MEETPTARNGAIGGRDVNRENWNHWWKRRREWLGAPRPGDPRFPSGSFYMYMYLLSQHDGSLGRALAQKVIVVILSPIRSCCFFLRHHEYVYTCTCTCTIHCICTCMYLYNIQCTQCIHVNVPCRHHLHWLALLSAFTYTYVVTPDCALLEDRLFSLLEELESSVIIGKSMILRRGSKVGGILYCVPPAFLTRRLLLLFPSSDAQKRYSTRHRRQ